MISDLCKVWVVLNIQKPNYSCIRGSNLKKEVKSSSEMLITTYKTTRNHNPECHNLHIYRCMNFDMKLVYMYPSSFVLSS